MRSASSPLLLLLLLGATACGDTKPEGTPGDDDTGGAPDRVWDCVLEPEPVPDYGFEVGCRADYDLLAADPLDASIPGAQSAKTIIDRVDGNRLYFTNSELYPIHYEFASQFLSGGDLPIASKIDDAALRADYPAIIRISLAAGIAETVKLYEGMKAAGTLKV